jgi:DNA-binding cell septation regulator SpoVG
MLNRPELAKEFAEFEMPADIKAAYKAGVQLIGSLGFTKMMVFANQVQLTNDDIDYFVSTPPRRMEDESYEDMKSRTKFTNKLNKYRAHLYDYSVYENQ